MSVGISLVKLTQEIATSGNALLAMTYNTKLYNSLKKYRGTPPKRRRDTAKILFNQSNISITTLCPGQA